MLMRGVEQLGNPETARHFATVPTDDLRLDPVKAIESLPPTCREVVLLRDLEELTITEIGERLRLTREATKSRSKPNG